MPRRTRDDRQAGRNLATCSLELVSIAPGLPNAEEDERGSPRRKAATTIDTATAEEDVKDCDCACASSRTCLQRVFGKSTVRYGYMATPAKPHVDDTPWIWIPSCTGLLWARDKFRACAERVDLATLFCGLWASCLCPG